MVNPLSVSVQPNGKKRLILDLRYVNKHLIKQIVKYEDWKIALSYFQKRAFMISFDLKSSYHHIAGFHSRDQQPCFSTKTKGSVCIIIELNSRRIWSGHQHGRLFFV